ncbi:MAG: CDP-alcohol phosphatidyltransferase family protein [Armatimonadota bacterium]
MNSINITLGNILKDRLSAYPEHTRFKWYSYSDYKARFYVYVSVPLIYAFLKLRIPPNAITFAYILFGIFAGVCLCINNSAFVYTAIIIFFLRPILDWCDGAVAKYTGKGSLEGHCLDVYGAYSGWIALWTGLGFYAYYKTGFEFIIYILPVVPLIFALDIKAFSLGVLLDREEPPPIGKNEDNTASSGGVEVQCEVKTEKRTGLVSRIMNFITKIFFTHRARTVDLICLIILIELNSSLNIMWIYYLGFVAFHLLQLVVNYILFLRGSFLKEQIDKIRDFGRNV